MIKKIYIILFVAIMISSCGKKGDPVYKKENQNSGKISVQITYFSWFIKKTNFFLIILISAQLQKNITLLSIVIL